MVKTISFQCLVAQQSSSYQVVSFVAKAKDIEKFAQITRIGRDNKGSLFGFQRSQIGHHIQEIHDYLEKDDSVLPNALIVAFVSGAKINVKEGSKTGTIEIDLKDNPVGFIVDGQQRYSALRMLEDKKFEVFISAIICKTEEELQKQFILINNTRPLSKDLIYELLPSVDGLPPRLTGRTFASKMTQDLNFKKDSIFYGLIKLHTNPYGTISPNSVQKVIMNSKTNGAMREIFLDKGYSDCMKLIDNFFTAISKVFEDDWFLKDSNGQFIYDGNKNKAIQRPNKSRLTHGAGIVSMGHIMDTIFTIRRFETVGQFIDILNLIKPYTAWSSGSWKFESGEKNFSEIQNIGNHISELRDFLFKKVTDELLKLEQDKITNTKR